jgi:hypothetical protein
MSSIVTFVAAFNAYFQGQLKSLAFRPSEVHHAGERRHPGEVDKDGHVQMDSR